MKMALHKKLLRGLNSLEDRANRFVTHVEIAASNKPIITSQMIERLDSATLNLGRLKADDLARLRVEWKEVERRLLIRQILWFQKQRYLVPVRKIVHSLTFLESEKLRSTLQKLKKIIAGAPTPSNN